MDLSLFGDGPALRMLFLAYCAGVVPYMLAGTQISLWEKTTKTKTKKVLQGRPQQKAEIHSGLTRSLQPRWPTLFKAVCFGAIACLSKHWVVSWTTSAVGVRDVNATGKFLCQHHPIPNVENWYQLTDKKLPTRMGWMRMNLLWKWHAWCGDDDQLNMQLVYSKTFCKIWLHKPIHTCLEFSQPWIHAMLILCPVTGLLPLQLGWNLPTANHKNLINSQPATSSNNYGPLQCQYVSIHIIFDCSWHTNIFPSVYLSIHKTLSFQIPWVAPHGSFFLSFYFRFIFPGSRFLLILNPFFTYRILNYHYVSIYF